MKRKTDYLNNAGHPTNVEILFLTKIKDLFTRGITPHITIMFFHFECNLQQTILKPGSQQTNWKQTLRTELSANKILPTAPIVVTELANGGDLEDYLRERTRSKLLTELEWRVLLFQVLHMLVVMQYHFPGFRHNDLKPNNILVNTYDKKSNNYFVYEMLGHTYYVPDIGITLKLWDFDFSLDNNTPNNRQHNKFYKEFGYSNELNPIYDVHSFFNYLYSFNNPDLLPSVKTFVETILPASLRGKDARYTKHYRLTNFNVSKNHRYINIIPHTLKSSAEFLTTEKQFLDFTKKPSVITAQAAYDTQVLGKDDIRDMARYNSLFRDRLRITQIKLY